MPPPEVGAEWPLRLQWRSVGLVPSVSPALKIAPPPYPPELLLRVLLPICSTASFPRRASLQTPPPNSAELFRSTLLLIWRVALPPKLASLQIPPPSFSATLPITAQSLSISVAWSFKMPPPSL